MLIDTHCHLTDERLTDTKEVLRRARAAGVTKVIMPSTSLEDAKRAAVIAVQENQYSLAGIHPEELETVEDVETEMEAIKRVIESSSRVVGIGEIGLDFYFDKEKKTEKKQKELFRKQMDLAVEMRMPVAIHMRGAEEEMTKELIEIHRLPTGQFHCFAGSEDFLKMVLKMGFYVRFAGNITYKSAANLPAMLHQLTLNKVLFGEE